MGDVLSRLASGSNQSKPGIPYVGFRPNTREIKSGLTVETGLITLARNTDLVPVNATSGRSTGTGVLTATTSPGDSVLVKYKTDRIRQTGSIAKIDLAEIQALTEITSLKFYIWRKDGSTYDKIATLDLLPLVSAGLNSLTLASPIAVQEGDFWGLHMQRTSNAAFIAATTLSASIMYTVSETPSDVNYAWDSKTEGNAVPRSILFMQAPLLAPIGDSIIEGYPAHSSFVDSAFAQVDIAKTWIAILKGLDSRCEYQNLGVGGNTTTQILARLTSQAVTAKPRFCVVNGGVNDIAGGSITKAVFLSNWDKILSILTANNIYPIVWSIMPWTDGTTGQNQTRDEWNNDLAALVATYPHAKYIDWDPILGQERAGGDAGNYWDIKTAYDSDGVHFNLAGNTAIANHMLTVLKSSFTTIPTTYVTAYQAVHDSFTVKPSAGVAWLYNRYVKRLVDCGYWSVLTGLRMYAIHTTGADALKDWKKLDRIMSIVGTVTFTAYEGQAGNGIDGYIRTGFNPATETGFGQNAHHFGLYCRTSRAASSTKGEGCLGASSYVAMQLRSGAGNFIGYASTITGASVANTETKGMFVVRRNESGKVDLWKNGVEIDPDNVANSAALPNLEYYSGAYNNAGSPTYYNNDQKSVEFQGGDATDAQLLEFYNAFQQLMNAFEKAI